MRLLIFVLCLSRFIDAQYRNYGPNGRPLNVPMPVVPEEHFKQGDLPFMVALLDNRNESKPFFCAGTLITARHVLTGEMRKNLNNFVNQKLVLVQSRALHRS